MKNRIHKLSYCIAFLFNLLPEFIFKFAAFCLAFLWVDVFRIRRKVILDNMTLAFPEVDLLTKKKWMKFSVYVMAKNLFDLFRIPFVTDAWINKNIVFHGFENLDNIKGGCFFLSLHMASGDLGVAAISKKIKPISLISKRFKNKIADEFWFSIREHSGAKFINAHAQNNAFDILKALKAGRGVVFVLDQFMGKPYGVETDFFNKKTGTAYGLALFAQKTQKPVLPLYSYWGNDGRLNVRLKPAIDLSNLITDDTDVNNVSITNCFNREIETIIRSHPDHWMWVHKRWKVFE